MLNKWFCCGLLTTTLGLGCLSASPVDGPPEPNENRAPIAVPSAGSDYPVGSQVTLQGQDSFDPDGDLLLYHWAVGTPDMGETIEAMGAEFILDLQRPGVYFVELTVEDPHGASSSATVHVAAIVPVVEIELNAGQNGAVEIFQQVAVQGTIEVNGTPETSFSWQLLSVPQDSTAQLADTSTLEPSFVADRVGEYVIELRVDSPWATFKSEVVVIATASQFAPNHRYRAFDYSPAVGKFVGTFFSAANDQLQILDPSNWAVNEVSFPRPNGVAFSSDGTQIVLGYGTSATPYSTAVVDTSSGAILQTIPGVSPERLRTAIDNQIVFTEFNSAKTLNLTTHVVSTTSGTFGPRIVSATNAGNKFYSWRFNSPRHLGRLEVTSTGPLFLGPHELAADDCAPLWASPSEQFMISACGNILRVSDDETLDLTELASLSVTSIEAAVHATSLGLIIVATDEGGGEFALRAFNDVTFEEEWVRVLPEWYEHQSTQPLTIFEPRALYMLSDGQTLLVVGQRSFTDGFLRFRL